MIESNKDEYRNILNVNGMMMNKMILISKKCVNLLNEIKNYKWKQAKLGASRSEKEQPVDKEDDAIDAMLYLVNYLSDGKSAIDKDKEKAEQQSIAYLTTRNKKDRSSLG